MCFVSIKVKRPSRDIFSEIYKEELSLKIIGVQKMDWVGLHIQFIFSVWRNNFEIHTINKSRAINALELLLKNSNDLHLFFFLLCNF